MAKLKRERLTEQECMEKSMYISRYGKDWYEKLKETALQKEWQEEARKNREDTRTEEEKFPFIKFCKNREKLLKDGEYVLYEDEKIVIFQRGHGAEPRYLLWAKDKASGIIEMIYAGYTDKFTKVLNNAYDGIRDDSIRLTICEDFELAIDRYGSQFFPQQKFLCGLETERKAFHNLKSICQRRIVFSSKHL